MPHLSYHYHSLAYTLKTQYRFFRRFYLFLWVFSLLFYALSVTDAARLVKGTSFIFLRAVMVSDTLGYMMDKSTSSLSKVLVKEARDVHTSHSKLMK